MLTYVTLGKSMNTVKAYVSLGISNLVLIDALVRSTYISNSDVISTYTLSQYVSVLVSMHAMAVQECTYVQ